MEGERTRVRLDFIPVRGLGPLTAPSLSLRYLATWPNREPPSRIGEILQEAFPRYLLKDGEKKEPMLTWDNSKVWPGEKLFFRVCLPCQRASLCCPEFLVV